MKNNNRSTSVRREGRSSSNVTFPSNLENINADAPVPDRLMPKSKARKITRGLKVSQQLGLLLWLHSSGKLTSRGRERLLHLQEKFPLETTLAAVQFAIRLRDDKRLQLSMKHQAIELNRWNSRKLRKFSEQRRIGIGYRDKGTLADISSKGRRDATKGGYVHLNELEEELRESVIHSFPNCLLDGEWVDLELLRQESFW